jgi:tyrosyl-tRNA synthetase
MRVMDDFGLQQLLQGCEHVYAPEELRTRLQRAAAERRPLRVKLGMDPTAPDIHLGHTVVLRKLRQFQDLGHLALLIIGDFTSRIGDPTGRSKTRPVLSDEEIEANATTYLQQAGRVLDLSPGKIEIRRNSEWLAPMTFADVLRLTARMTVGQMLTREDFRNRYQSETPIGLHELLYPLVQGWDSVNIRADVELGGTDQTYNNLVGRQLQSDVGQSPQVVMILPLLRGTDGERKMSKSLGNYVAVSDSARDMYGKTMSIPDACLEEWFRLLTDVPDNQWRQAIAEHPMKAKDLLARRVGARFHSGEEMSAAGEWWREHFSEQRVESVPVRVEPREMQDGCVPAWRLVWLAHGGAISNSEARRMVQGGAFECDGQKVSDPQQPIRVAPGKQFRAGRHRAGERIRQPLVAVMVVPGASD